MARTQSLITRPPTRVLFNSPSAQSQFKQEFFADFTVFNKNSPPELTINPERKRIDSAGYNNSETSTSSISPHRSISETVEPHRYDAIKQLDEEEKMKRTKSDGPKVVEQKRRVAQQERMLMRTRSCGDPTELFMRAQFGSPTSTGHALFG